MMIDAGVCIKNHSGHLARLVEGIFKHAPADYIDRYIVIFTLYFLKKYSI